MAKILVVDGTERTGESCTRALEGVGHSVVVARNCHEAVESIRRERPEVLVAEPYEQPGGAEEIVWMLAQGRGIPIIVHATNGRTAKEFGAPVAALVKKKTPRELLRAIAEVLARRGGAF